MTGKPVWNISINWQNNPFVSSLKNAPHWARSELSKTIFPSKVTMTQMVLSACNQGKKTLTSWSPFRGICNHLEGAPDCSAEAQCGTEHGAVCACQNQHSVTGTCSEPPCNNSPNGLYQALTWPCFPEPYGSCVVLAGRGWPWVVLRPRWSWHMDFSPGKGWSRDPFGWGWVITDIMGSEMRELTVCICTCPLPRPHVLISDISGQVCD